MDTSNWIALAALLISLASFGISAYAVFLDRPRLKASAEYILGHDDFSQEHLIIKITNTGKGSAVLRLFGGTLESGSDSAEYLGHFDHGLRLGSHDFYERKLTREDIYVHMPDEDSRYVDLWFEDSLGNRYPVARSKELIHRLLSAYGDIRS